MSIKKAFIIIGIVAIVLAGGLYYYKNKNKVSIYTTALIEKGGITQTVSETGTVKSISEINLSFPASGKLAKKYFKVGDKVKAGDALAELDYKSLEISRLEAQANYDSAVQNLNKLRAGATASEIAVKQAGVDQARISFDAATNEYAKTVDTANESIAQAKKKLSDLESHTISDVTAYEQSVSSAETTLANTKTTYQTSINNYKDTALVTVDAKNAMANSALDVIYRTLTDKDGKDLISVQAPHYLTDTNSDYNNAKILAIKASAALSTAKINPTEDNVKNSVNTSLDYLNITFDALQNCFSALENSVTSSDFTQSDLDTFKSNISAQKTNVSSAISSVQSSKQSLNDAILAYTTNLNTATENLISAQAAYNDAVKNAKNALSTAQFSGDQQKAMSESAVNRAKEAWNLAQAQLEDLLSPANRYDISLADSKVRQAQASLDQVNQNISNSIIKSPIDGMVTKLNYEIDEQVPAGQTMVSILGENNFEIEVLISEADIAKVNIDDKTEVTLDSYGDDVKFQGKVVFIEPAETNVQDVVYYKVKISFDPAGKDVKSGMTANVIITTAQKADVLIIPARAIIDKGVGGKIARVLVNDKIQEKPIITGLQGDGGMNELISGANEGDAVVTYVKAQN